MLQSVCQSVALYISRANVQIFCVYYTLQSTSDHNAIHYVLSFVDNVMFSDNGANGPKIKYDISSSLPSGSTSQPTQAELDRWRHWGEVCCF